MRRSVSWPGSGLRRAVAGVNHDGEVPPALERVYTGLVAMTAWTALLLTALAYTGLHF